MRYSQYAKLRFVRSTPYTVEYSGAAAKQLASVPADKRRVIVERLEVVAQDPFAPNPNLKPLKGVKNTYRLRVGDWRASYLIIRIDRVLRVIEVASRGGAYRWET